MKATPVLATVLGVVSLSLPACHKHEEHAHQEHHKIVATSPKVEDVTVTQQYVCQIRSQRNTAIRSLQDGYLEPIAIREGQWVKAGTELFRINPTLFNAKLAAEEADAKLALSKFNATAKLYSEKVVSVVDVNQAQAELDKANARVELARAELKFAAVVAPFDGIVDRLEQMQGSLVKKDDVLTTLSDNSVMWVYFNVPEARYFEYKARQGKGRDNSQLKLVDSRVELVLADGSTFEVKDPDGKPGRPVDTVTVEGKFNNETGNIPFRADFPNPDGLLRHGQTGNVLIHRKLHDAVVIPQRATFEVLDKRYVFVLDHDEVVHRREIAVQYELEDVFVVKKGLGAGDRIVLEGVRQVNDGDKVEYEFRKPDEALAHQKNHAE